MCEHYLTNSISYINSSLITADTCLFEFEVKTILACPPITTECVVSSNDGQNYDLTKLKQLSGTGFQVSLSNLYNDIPANADLKISVSIRNAWDMTRGTLFHDYFPYRCASR